MASQGSDGPDSSGFVHAVSCEELEDEGRMLVNRDGHAIALFAHDGAYRAVDNRCPHMGFPLTEGTVDDGILTCHWHHARFELSCGDTFDPWADDLPTYPLEVREGEIWVKPSPVRDAPPAEHWADRLEVGLEEDLRLVLAKAAIGLDDAQVDPVVPFRKGLRFGTTYRDEGWSSGLTIHTALARVGDGMEPSDRRRAIYHGLVAVADDCAGSPPRFDQPALSADVGSTRLKEWFRNNVEVRDSDGAERTIRAAVRDCEQHEVAEMVLAAGTDHRYLDGGHALDHCNKAFEALDRAGWEKYAADALASTVGNLAQASRSEEAAEWRQPIDIAGLVSDAANTLRGGTDARGEWTEPESFLDSVLTDDPERVIEAVVAGAQDGASPATLAGSLVDAAARRLAQFSTANEFSDWNTVHHTYTYANAIHGLTRRTSCWEGYRGVLDVAANLYLDRFLNVPPATIPEGDASEDPDIAVQRFLDAVEREGGVDEAGRAIADALATGTAPERICRALASALLREDAGFHDVQNLEVAVTQVERSSDPGRVKLHLIAAARYLAAHTPTRREREQTFTIAERLHRGERIHEATDGSGA